MEVGTPAPAAAPASPTQSAQPGSNAPDAKAPAQATPPAEKAPPKVWEQKVNGKVRRYTEEELLARASLADAAQERFEEGARLRKQAEQVVGKMRDPKQVINALQDPALGLSKEAIREAFEEWYVREFIEPETLSPEQKKLREAEARLQKYEEQERQRKQQEQQDAQEHLTSQAREQIQNQIIEVLESGKLPKTNFTIRRLAYWMQKNLANGFDAPTSLLVSQVKNEAKQNLIDLVEASDGEVLVQLFGDSMVQKIRKYDLEQLRKVRGTQQRPPEQQQSYSRPEPTDRPTSADVNRKIRELQRSGQY